MTTTRVKCTECDNLILPQTAQANGGLCGQCAKMAKREFDWRDRDEEGSILFFEFVSLEWQIEFDVDSNLRCITVTSEPIMGIEEQRLAYGVTELWPPTPLA